MAINTYLSKIESKNKIHEQAGQKQTHRHREHFDGYQMERGWGMDEKSEGIKYNLVVTE